MKGYEVIAAHFWQINRKKKGKQHTSSGVWAKMFEFKITFSEFVQVSSRRTSGVIPESELIVKKFNETVNF